MGFDKIYFNYNNPFFCVGEMFEIPLDNGYLCVEEPNSMEGIFDVDIFNRMSFSPTHEYPIYEYVNVGEKYKVRVKMLDENDEYGDRNKKINGAVRQYVSEAYSVDNVTEYLIGRGSTIEQIKEWHELEFFYSENHLVLTGYSDAVVILTNDSEIEIMFDGKTGEVIEFSDLLKDGWQDHIKIVKSEELSSGGYRQHTPEESADIDKNIIPANAKFTSLTDYLIRYGMPSNGIAHIPLVFECADSGLAITVYIDSDYVKDFSH